MQGDFLILDIVQCYQEDFLEMVGSSQLLSRRCNPKTQVHNSTANLGHPRGHCVAHIVLAANAYFTD